MGVYDPIRPNPSVTETSIAAPWPPRASVDFGMTLFDGEVLNDEVIKLIKFEGQESISQPYQVKLELRSNDAPTDGTRNLNFEKIIGANATVRIGLAETDESVQQPYPEKRAITYVNGIITSFLMAEPGVYHATLKPELFKLTLCNDYQIYHGTIKQVVEEVVTQKHGLNADFSRVQGLANDREQDWMQAGEDDLSFITRLMQKVFIYYYFEHSEGSHKIIFSDQFRYQELKQRRFKDNGSFYYTNDIREIRYTFNKQASMDEQDWILAYQYEQQLTSQGFRNVIAQTQAAWEEDATSKLSVFENDDNRSEKLNNVLYQSVQYGSSKQEVDEINDFLANQLATAPFKLSGSTNCSELRPCTQFKLVESIPANGDELVYDSYQVSVRPELDGHEMVITSFQFSGDIAGSYQASFEAISANGSVIPYNAQNTQQGSVYATVMAYSKSTPNQLGPTIDYLYRDSFDWGTQRFESKLSNESEFSCKGVYVKFATDPSDAPLRWVKLAEHMQTIPELGVTVTISRSNDGSEIPEVGGIIQSKGNKVILPDGATDNTNVGDSHSTSYGDNWSIHFGKYSPTDLNAAVEMVEEKKATNKYSSVSYSIGGSFGYSSSDDGKNGILSDSVSYGSSHSESYAAEQTSHSEVDRQVGYSKTGYSENTSETGTQKSTSTTGTSENTSTVGTSTSTSTVGTTNDTSTVGSSTSSRVEGSSNSTSATGQQNSASAVGMQNSANVLGMGNSVSATGMNNSVSVTGMQSSANATGMNNSANAVGMDNSASLVGMSNSASLTGMQNSASILGMSNSSNIVGMSSSLNVTGTSTNISVSGPSTNVDVSGPGVDVKIGSARVSIHNDPAMTDITIGSDSMVIKAPGIELQILYGIDLTM
ncbi:contractile injection system protein, VgrG/Pvc8 family [Aliikangiella coralliicola]|uniref:Type VI secretion system tip protein VgrG n=1 Tax=Aliikangiella coralliicola TaxID=2592383 RepID=A0A545UCS5_9GAMM|nr:contractile injection system protein, VgrG/Pvc8 family [Aliikangiella coralliicola]TQV87265.1 hypothetical protein FLL46_12495 [Aliikangiella coralliicola]